MEKDQILFPKLSQLKLCRFLLCAVTKLMLSHFFKSDDLTRPKNIFNMINKGTDYLKLWYHFLQDMFAGEHANNAKFDEFTNFDVPIYLLKRRNRGATHKNATFLEESQNTFISPRQKRPELTLIQTFSEKVEHDDNPEKFINLSDLSKFEKKFYCREFVVYLMKINICWCIYYEKYLFILNRKI